MAVRPWAQRRAWRLAFDLAVEVFRLTGRLEDHRTNGFASRARRTAIRVPALITRSVAGGRVDPLHDDLTLALGCLEDLEADVRLCLGLAYTEPGEVRHITQQLQATRGEILRMIGPGGHDTAPEGQDPMARDSLRRRKGTPQRC